MKAIVFDRFGEPADVLSVRDVPVPEPKAGEVLVRMIASPINPSDLLVVRGRYGVLPNLPATPGFEGVGIVEKAGSGFLGKMVLGKRVTVINSAGGNWAEYAVIPARQARPVPKDLPDEQAASFFINPATALAMLRHVLRVPQGEFLLQTAANSTLGRMFIKLARHDGVKTINVVRRREAAEEVRAVGGDVVICSEDGPIDEQILAQTNQRGVRYAIDPVAGETGTRVFRSLACDGKLLVYGSLTHEPIAIDPRMMIAGKRVVEGFWLGHWMRGRSIPESLLLFHQIGKLMREGVLATEPGKGFGLESIVDAVKEAERPGRRGKALLRIGSA